MYEIRHKLVTLFCMYSISANNSSFCLRREKIKRKKKLLERTHEIERKN